MPPLSLFQKSFIAVAVGQALLPSNLSAATITVNTTTLPGSLSECDLYDAFISANTNTVVDGCISGDVGADTIELPAYVSFTLNNSRYSDERGLLVESEITLQGNGSQIRRSVSPKRLIDISEGGNLVANNIELRDGRLNIGGLGGGAAIRVDTANLELRDSTLRYNSVTSSQAQPQYGGAIFATNSTVLLERVYGRSNRAVGELGSGGLIRAEDASEIIINTSSLAYNSSTESGGAVSLVDSRISVEGSSFRGNRTGDSGGAIDSSGGDIEINASYLTRNSARLIQGNDILGGVGGAISITDATLSISSQSDFYRNSASLRGAAINVDGTGVLNLDKSSIRRSRVYGTYNGNVVADGTSGGAIALYGGALGNSVISNSTLAANTAEMAGTLLVSGGELTLSNVTIVGGEGGEGNRLVNDSGIALYAEGDAVININNSVFSQSLLRRPLNPRPIGSLCTILGNAQLGQNQNNIFQDATCDLTSAIDPMLSPRTSFRPDSQVYLGVGVMRSGGESERGLRTPPNISIYIPRFNSPLLDAGDVTVCSSMPVSGVDQRGLAHAEPLLGCDIGAIDSRETIIMVDSMGDAVPDSLAVCTINDALLSAQVSGGEGGEGTREIPRSGATCAVSYDQTIIRFDNTIFPTGGNSKIMLQPGPKGSLPRVDGVVSIQGPGQSALEVRGGGGGQILYSRSASLDISDISISGGQAGSNSGSSGGGALSARESMVTMNRVTVTGNSAVYENGGAISLQRRSKAEIVNSTISNSYSGRRGGGVYLGGESSLLLNRSTVSGNSAMGSSYYGGEGGGIFSGGESSLRMINSTVSGNSSEIGGGIYLELAHVNLLHTTISDNMASRFGGGVHIRGRSKYGDNALISELTLNSSILSGNKANGNTGNEIALNANTYSSGEIATVNVQQSLFGSAESTYDQAVLNFDPTRTSFYLNGASILATSLDAHGGANSRSTAIDHILRPLSGTVLEAHNLVSGSPAINAGQPNGQCALSIDQRSASRNDEACDLGSIEFDGTVFFIIRAANGSIVTIAL